MHNVSSRKQLKCDCTELIGNVRFDHLSDDDVDDVIEGAWSDASHLGSNCLLLLLLLIPLTLEVFIRKFIILLS